MVAAYLIGTAKQQVNDFVHVTAERSPRAAVAQGSQCKSENTSGIRLR
jgi:hypothetical protein